MRPAHILGILDREFLVTRDGHHTPVMLWGPPGVGKSQMVMEVAEKHAVSVIDIRLSQMEPTDLRGIPFRTGDTVDWAIPSILPDTERHGSEGILFLDEITSAAPTVSAAAYQLILDRRLGNYRIPDGWAIFAAGNRQGDRGVTYTMPAPLANRFSHFEVDAHLDDWVAWAYRKGIDERVIAFLRFRPELLFDFDPAHNPVAFPSPRSWEFAHRALQKFGDHKTLLLGSLQACVGPAAGIELKAFVDNLDNMPDIDAILRGEDALVPTEIDLQYAVAAALVGRAIQAKQRGNTSGNSSDNSSEKRSDKRSGNGSNNASDSTSAKGTNGSANLIYGHILDYAGHFSQKEMGVMLVSDMHRAVGASIFSVPQFTKWAKDIGDIMLYNR